GKKGKMLATAGIHARELTTGETLTRFAEYLLQNYGADPEVTWVLDYTEIHLILHANPDGRIYIESEGGMWKKNRNNATNCNHRRFGVDNNRNFPFKWGGCIATDESRCSTSDDCSSVVYRGKYRRSEQETKAILDYALSIFPASQRNETVQKAEVDADTPFSDTNEGIYLDLHSHGSDIGWPWGYKNVRSPNDDGLGSLGRKFASFNGYSLWAPEMSNRVCE
ncbi:hypothetical protein THAPSDRAFT_bd894, partial [Thalassiosira pseudonana CCMP1335]